MPFSTLAGLYGGDQGYIKELVDASRSLLHTVVEGLLPGGYLQHAPVRTYFRIVSGAMFLLKVSCIHLLGSSPLLAGVPFVWIDRQWLRRSHSAPRKMKSPSLSVYWTAPSRHCVRASSTTSI